MVAEVSSYQEAHHPKIDAPSSLEIRNAALLEQWRTKKAAGYVARDAFSREARIFLDGHHANRRLIARAWLADTRARRRERLRQSLRVVIGGRK